MNRGRFRRNLAMGLCGLFLVGCNAGCIERIFQNAIIGFGFSLGALPANILADQLFAGLLGGTDGA